MFPSNSSSSDSLFGLGEHDIVARKGNTHGDDVSASVAHVHAAHRSAADLRLAEVRTDQLEVILASEVTVYELLGVGTFGDMYKARWRECDVAVKCLNPAAVGLQYTSRSAWLGFLEDANAMGALRHPNLIEVYGVVLPGAPDAGAQLSQQAEHMQRALDGEHVSLGGRRTSWDFSSTGTGAVGGDVDLDRLPSINVTGHQRLPGPLANPPAIVMEYMPGRSLKNAIERGDDAVAGKLARVIYALDVARALKYLHSRGVTHYDLKSTNILLGWRHRRPMAKVAGYGLSNRKVRLYFYFFFPG
jgi:serine/threonine protein kinase